MNLRPLLCVLPLFLFTACVTTGSVKEMSTTPPLSQYKTAIVRVRAFDTSAKNAALKVKTCAAEIPTKLTDARVFDSVYNASSNGSADLIVSAIIVDTQESVRFSGVVREDQSVNLEINLIDGTTSSTVAQLAVNGNSKSNSSMSVGGIDVENFSDLFRKSCGRAGEHLAKFLKKKRAL